ncbi:YraN family protein [Helcobacillus massiliensis]|uniref:UPF0102 protein FHX50_000013 n=1 Tax=Helcobacillus massiliensis TaxID=521392 RepID=A0A839QPP0_9MICO|nr:MULTISPECIES: YraN family protein [Helcobacillus]MBB3021765.1 putative endonuclease [Helcobacillus massiliensis]MCG7427764.1 YraN family protein [Helcobacillus sp. ACRRO]MCT1557905.1 YraN family protein [Helcobacillus massiliensis]MCT2036529.1 YraN family protein [Helcobacillus massiliensis]MCT2332570.1 YraN family protein [Helcobacillus massiliensis]
MSIAAFATGDHIAAMSPREIGRLGEDLAVRRLVRDGWTIHDRNFRTRRGEIDIVASDGDTLVFVEVKTRRPSHVGAGVHAVDENKVRRLRTMAGYYLMNRAPAHSAIRIDVMSIAVSVHAEPRIDHIQDVCS